MFQRARPSLARIAVPRLSVPTFIWTVYLRIVFSVVCDTSCTKAKSKSCRHKKSSSICRRVLDDIALMFKVAILNVWNIIVIMRVGGGGTWVAEFFEFLGFCGGVLYRSVFFI